MKRLVDIIFPVSKGQGDATETSQTDLHHVYTYGNPEKKINLNIGYLGGTMAGFFYLLI